LKYFSVEIVTKSFKLIRLRDTRIGRMLKICELLILAEDYPMKKKMYD
jgi:hypothetical protein